MFRIPAKAGTSLLVARGFSCHVAPMPEMAAMPETKTKSMTQELMTAMPEMAAMGPKSSRPPTAATPTIPHFATSAPATLPRRTLPALPLAL